MTKRNEPCPCESGKKYKKCCLKPKPRPKPPEKDSVKIDWADEDKESKRYFLRARIMGHMTTIEVPSSFVVSHDTQIIDMTRPSRRMSRFASTMLAVSAFAGSMDLGSYEMTSGKSQGKRRGNRTKGWK